MSRVTLADTIQYDPAFETRVQGRLYARFQLDADGAPDFEEDEDRLRHYIISLFLHSPNAADIVDVTYVMDDETYVDPIGYSKDGDNDFREQITSYGEVPIIVRVNMGKGVFQQLAWLSNMLENGHSGKSNSAIRVAINRLKTN